MEVKSSNLEVQNFLSDSPETTFEIAERFGETIKSGDVVFLIGGLGAGKTLFTKGVLNAFEYDIDEVTSPSFSLVNVYKAKDFDVYHIDLWRIVESGDAMFAVGLDEILENERAVVIIEWADRLKELHFDRRVVSVEILGDGDEDREITIR